MKIEWNIYLGEQLEGKFAIPYNKPMFVKFDNGRHVVASYLPTGNWFDHIEQREIIVDGDHPFVVAYVDWSDVESVLGCDV